MFPKRIEFHTEERTHAFLVKRKEWVTFMTLDGGNRWLIKSWGYLAPTDSELAELTRSTLLALRAFASSIKIQTFNPEVYSDATIVSPISDVAPARKR